MIMMTKKERNEFMCQLYRDGTTQEELGNRFHITTARVGQILRRAGVRKQDRAVSRSKQRPTFTGVYLSKIAKNVLRAESKRDGKSMSQFISDLVLKELKERGADLTPTPDSREVPLPFGG